MLCVCMCKQGCSRCRHLLAACVCAACCCLCAGTVSSLAAYVCRCEGECTVHLQWYSCLLASSSFIALWVCMCAAGLHLPAAAAADAVGSCETRKDVTGIVFGLVC